MPTYNYQEMDGDSRTAEVNGAIISIPKEVQAFISATTMHYTKPEASWTYSEQWSV